VKLNRASGFTLVELMVSITLGLIILAAVSTVFVNSKRTYSTQDRLARLQENARFAMQFLVRDIRMAGYSGCMSDITAVNSSLNNGGFQFITNDAVEGLENATGNWYPSGVAAIPTSMKTGTDAIAVRLADPSMNISISKPMPNESAELNVDSLSGIKTNDIIMISDCSSADVMQITSTQDAALKIQHNGGGNPAIGDPDYPGNSTQKLSKQYKPPTQIFKFVTRTYFIRNNGNGVPSLYVQENGASAQELVEGIEDLQVVYGKDSDATPDGVPNTYLRAGAAGLTTAADWSQVRSIRIGMLVRTLDNKDADVDIHSSYDVNGNTFNVPAGDKYQRRVFSSTILVRNHGAVKIN